MNKSTKIYVFLAGITLVLIGAYISLTPFQYLSQFDLTNEISVELMSEMRGMGGALLVFGIFAFMATFVEQIAKTALTISILIFTSFFMFRCIGVVIDGVPSHAILIALGIEMLFAICGILIWLKTSIIAKKAERHA